jgi:hypothetical protein
MSAPFVIANTLGLELTTSREFNNEYQYQPGRTKKPIYNLGGAEYFCVSKSKPTDAMGGEWVKHTDQFWAQQKATTLWVANANEAG